MKRPKRDPVREDRIHNEAIVDARPQEQAMSWYYYLAGKIRFPFQARCIIANTVSPLRKGETVEVLRMASEEVCEHDMFVQIGWQERKLAVPLTQLDTIDPDESTQEAIGDWHYWSREATASDFHTATVFIGRLRSDLLPLAARVRRPASWNKPKDSRICRRRMGS